MIEGDQKGLEPCLRIEYLTTDSYPPPNKKKRMTTFWSPSFNYSLDFQRLRINIRVSGVLLDKLAAEG